VTLTADGFHPVFQLQLAFFEGDFFDLFGIGEVVPVGELMEPVV
jgi:hypothetical protein